MRSIRWVLCVLGLVATIPAGARAIPTVTASPNEVLAGATGVAVGLYFNVAAGEFVQGGDASVRATSGTVFVSNVNGNVGGTQTTGGLSNFSDPAQAGYVFGPNCGNTSTASCS